MDCLQQQKDKYILITGAAGFIGYRVSQEMLQLGYSVVGLDNLNNYYSVQLKKSRLAQLQKSPNFEFVYQDVSDGRRIQELFQSASFTHVIHLAAQAGVAYSLENPEAYIDSNITGFLHILEGCRHYAVGHLVYASSSSVYGLNTCMPYRVRQHTEHPISLYAATKKANELMAHSYSYLYNIPCTGLRFFTVYGPWGRPDMALFLFTKAIFEGRPIDAFNYGRARRSFTYIDDVVAGISRILDRAPSPDPDWCGAAPEPSSSMAPYNIYNLGNGTTSEVSYIISILEDVIGKKAKVNYLPMRPGDVPDTYADTSDLENAVQFRPSVPIEIGLKRFVDWYKDYYCATPLVDQNRGNSSTAHAVAAFALK